MDAFDDKLAACRPRLVAFARRRLPHSEREWGSDYVQDALVEAHHRADLVRLLTPAQTYAWLRDVLIRKMDNGYRARRQAKRDCCRECAIDDLPADVLADDAASPVAAAARHEQCERIDAALSGITDDQRLAIALHFFADWTLEEIAHQLGIARPSALGLIRRGLGQLARGGVLSPKDLA